LPPSSTACSAPARYGASGPEWQAACGPGVGTRTSWESSSHAADQIEYIQPPMAPATRFRSNSPPVIQETIDGETIMVNLDTGSYYWLDPLASYISGAVQAGASIEELVADMTERFPD